MIVISERVHPIALEMLSSYEICYDPDLYSQRGALLRVLSRARGLIVRNKTQVDAELLAHAPHLKVVGRLGVGLDNIQTDLLSAQGIQLIVPRGANAVSVAEYVMGMLIAFQRHLLALTQQVRQGGWIRDMSGLEIDGRTLAVVGYGATGQAVAQRAQAFHMRLRVYDPFAQVPQTGQPQH
ncbi:NAD(P)-dependent oxidoreductase [Sulfobacillus thermosulfidooxidans]|uniref:NAD(P)-dependent oxidoreductase n=1 Tax=Sulfobacillus thermosulfidooxidans TaxID=28034 RepID=UPI0002D94C98|nr:NAD(P)-dependent oxidoreductase [Sulfobacillus thermosulfidooxidans]